MIFPTEYSEDSLLARLTKDGMVKDYTSLVLDKSKIVSAQFFAPLGGAVQRGARLKMPYDTELDNSKITAIDVVNTTELVNNTFFKDISGDFRPNLDNTQLKDLVFVLGRNDEQLAIIPAFTLSRANNNGKHSLFNSSAFIWADSYFEVVNDGNIQDGDVVVLKVFYEEIK